MMVKKKKAIFIGIILLALLEVFFCYAGVGIVTSDSPLARMENKGQSPGSALISPEAETVTAQAGEELRGDRLRNEVVELLREVYPDMLYYRVILSRLQERGYEIGGKDPGLNLIAHISKDKRIKRGDKRGYYGVDESYTDAGKSS